MILGMCKGCFECRVKMGVESPFVVGLLQSNLMIMCTNKWMCVNKHIWHDTSHEWPGLHGLPTNYKATFLLHHHVATLASIEVSQPAHVYALLFSCLSLNTSSSPSSPLISCPQSTPVPWGYCLRQLCTSAAWALTCLWVPPAPIPECAVLQPHKQGKIEADVALGKWFLHGAEGSLRG